MKKTDLIRWGSGLAVAAALFGGTVMTASRATAQDEPATLEQQLGGKLGVVDYDSLLKAHPDYARLEQFDQELSLLKQQRDFLPMAEREAKATDAKNRLRKELEKARQEMEAEQARISAELAGISDALAGKLRAEFEGEKDKMDAELKEFVKQHQPNEPQALPDTVLDDSDYVQNLNILRQREIAAQRIELEKARSDKIQAERSRIDAELAAYEDSIMLRNQQEKLNLQLAIQVAKDETEQAALEEKLSAISDEEARLKDAKRAELEGQFQSIKTEENARSQAELNARTAKVQAEFDRKVRERVGAAPPAVPSTNVPDISAEVKAKIKQKQAELEARLQARQAEMKAQMEAESAAAVGRLKAKQAEIEARLKQVQDEIKKAMADTSDLSPATQAKLDEMESRIKGLQAQRDELYDLMVSDLKDEIQKVAEKEKVDMVVGIYVHNEKGVDLTDRAMVAVKQMEAR